MSNTHNHPPLPRPTCWYCTVRVAHTDCDITRAWRAAMVALDRATRAYHQAIDSTELAEVTCNFAHYDAARTTEREAAQWYVLAVRAERVTRQAMVAATQARMGLAS